MKKLFLLLASAFMAAGASAQHQISVDNINPFKELHVNGKIELFVTMDENRPLSMTMDMNGNDPNQLNWWESDGALQIKFSPKSKAEPVIMRVNCHGLDGMDIQAASVTVDSIWQGNILTLNLASNAKLTAEIYCKDIRVTAQTGATAVLKGTARYADFEARSKCVIDARDFAGTSTTLRASGYSESYVYGKERLIVDAYDGASVFYRGTPEIMRQKTSRGGHTNPIGE